MKMKNSIQQNLERRYQTFINCQKPFEFFKGLAGYLEYIFSEPSLKKEFDKQLKERRVLIQQIEDTEKKIRGELNHAKSKLLALINKFKIDIKSFKRYQTGAFNEDTTILQELESFEKGNSVGNIFISDEIQRHLFDIAKNLFDLGYKKELKEFLNEEHKNFIFSKTYPERLKKVAIFQGGRILKSWGAFELLLQFNKVCKIALSNRTDWGVFDENSTEGKPWFGDASERVKLLDMVLEMRCLIENNVDFLDRVDDKFITRRGCKTDYLKPDKFKLAIDTVHGCLIGVVGEKPDNPVVDYYITKDQEENYYQDGNLINIPNKDTLYYIIFDVVYGLAPEGGEIKYQDIENILRKRTVRGIKIPSCLGLDINKRINRNLLNDSNGFFRFTNASNTIQGGRKLLESIGRGGKGIRFNNKK